MTRLLILFTLLLSVLVGHAQQYKHLVLKGGGIRGIAYAGALRVMEEKGVLQSIEKVGGTSVGALTGLMISLGCTSREIEDILFGLDIATFNDGKWSFVGGQQRLRKRYGWYRGMELETWIGKRIQEKAGNAAMTFGELHQRSLANKSFKDLYVTATNLSAQRLEIFSWETTPDMPIKTAVRATVSVPLYYSAVFMDSLHHVVEKPRKGCLYNIYVDGGLLANYPLMMFNTHADSAANRVNEYTLGLKLGRPEQIACNGTNKGIAPFQINSFKKYIASLYNITIEQLNTGIPNGEEISHSIYISTSNMSPRVRHITDEQKRALFNNGVDGARQFFEREK